MEHPGKALGTLLKARGWLQKDLAARTQTANATISSIIEGAQKFPEWLCVDLERLAMKDRYYWAKLCQQYDMYLAKKKWDDRIGLWKQKQ